MNSKNKYNMKQSLKSRHYTKINANCWKKRMRSCGDSYKEWQTNYKRQVKIPVILHTRDNSTKK